MKSSDRIVLRDYCQRHLFIRPSLWHRFLLWLGLR